MKKRLLSFALSVILLFSVFILAASADEPVIDFSGLDLMEGKYTEEQLRAYVENLKATAKVEPEGFRVIYLDWDHMGETIEESREILHNMTMTYIVPLLGETGYLQGEENKSPVFWIRADVDELYDIYLNVLLLLNGNTLFKAYMLGPITQPSEDEFFDDDTYFDIYGDLNVDRRLNVADYVLAKRYVLGTLELTEEVEIVLDVNADRRINVADYVLIKRYVMGTLDHFPVTENWYD